jgi:hypothetical protein
MRKFIAEWSSPVRSRLTHIGSLTVLSFDKPGSIPESELLAQGRARRAVRAAIRTSGLGPNILRKRLRPFHPIRKKLERIPEVRKSRNLLRFQLFW